LRDRLDYETICLGPGRSLECVPRAQLRWSSLLYSRGAQQADQPAGFRVKIKAKYLERRDRFLRRTKDLYFAVGCKILASEAGILPLTSSESYLAFIGDQTVVDTKDESLRQAAVQEGLVLLSQKVAAVGAENQIIEEIQILARGGPDESQARQG
jgi:hypothetical protein